MTVSVTSRGALLRPAIRSGHVVAWALWAVATTAVAVACLLIIATFSVDIPSRGFGFRGWVPIVGVLWATIGARIAARQPHLSVGWLILGVGVLWSLNAAFEEYATFAYFPQELGLPLVPQLVWFDNMVGSAVAGLAAIALLVVPDGRLRSRRWLVLELVIVGFTAMAVLTLAVTPRRLVPFPFENPFGLETLHRYDAYIPAVLRALDIGRGLEVLLPSTALLLRLRASRGIQRQQLKWVAFPACFASLMVFLYAFVADPVVQYAHILGLMLVPIAFGMAMRRYRLYDVDRIVDQTLVVGAATALVGGVYVASVGLIQRLFVALTGERSDAAVVLTTLLAAAAFTPVRDRIQGIVRGRFGGTLAGTRGLDSFTAEIDEHLRLSDRDQLLSQLLAESVSSLGATSGILELRDGAQTRVRKTIGTWTGDTHLAVDICEHGSMTGCVRLGARANGETYDADARRRLERAAEVVCLALERLDHHIPLASWPTPADAGAAASGTQIPPA